MAISIGSDNLVTLSNLTDNLTGDNVNTAAVTGTLLDEDDAIVSSFNLPYVTGSNGNYQGFIPASISGDLTEGASYQIRLLVVVGSNQQVFAEWDAAVYTLI